jgi:hypothetical protein
MGRRVVGDSDSGWDKIHKTWKGRMGPHLGHVHAPEVDDLLLQPVPEPCLQSEPILWPRCTPRHRVPQAESAPANLRLHLLVGCYGKKVLDLSLWFDRF